MSSSNIEADPAPVPLSATFCADDADVVIRAAGTRDFRVHTPILSLVSPVFRDMFTLPQPPDILGTLPRVDVNESAETWETILRTIYPIPNPVITTLHELESLFLAAMKYEIRSIVDIHKKCLENMAFIQQEPLRLYAIACSCGLIYQAKYVARNAELLTVMKCADAGDLRGLTVASYHNLVSFLVRRDNQWHQALSWARVPDCSRCSCYKHDVDELYASIKKNLKVARFSGVEVFLKASEVRSRSHRSGCGVGNCPVGDSEIKGFIERAIEERERSCDEFVPGPLVPGVFVPYSASSGQLYSTARTAHNPIFSMFTNFCICFFLYRVLRWTISLF